MERFEKDFHDGTHDYLVSYLQKNEEGFVFMDIQYAPQNGKHVENGEHTEYVEPVPLDAQKPIALMAKAWYEQNKGHVLTQFHWDNMAGGLRPKRPVTEQIWRAMRDDRTGEVLQHGNSQPGQTEMLSSGMWVGTLVDRWQ